MAISITAPADQTSVPARQPVEIDWSIDDYQQGQQVSLTVAEDASLNVAAQDAGGASGQFSITPANAGPLTLTANVLGSDGTVLESSTAVGLTVQAPAAAPQDPPPADPPAPAPADPTGSPAPQNPPPADPQNATPAATPSIAITSPADQSTATAGQPLDIDWSIDNYQARYQVSLTVGEDASLNIAAADTGGATGQLNLTPGAAGTLTIVVNVFGSDGTHLAESPAIGITVQTAQDQTPANPTGPTTPDPAPGDSPTPAPGPDSLPSIISFSVAAVVNDDSLHLPDSLELELGQQATLSWQASNSTSVELTGPDGIPQQIADGTTRDVTPTLDLNTYALVAISGEQRSDPPTVVHISTHAPGDVVSPHSDVTPAGTDEDDEAQGYDWVRSIIMNSDVTDYKKNKVLGKARFDSGKWKMNVLGMRGWIHGTGVVPRDRDKWRDTFYVAYINGDGKKCCESFKSTTEPGYQTADTIAKVSALRDNGNSHVLPNQYRYRRGLHNKRNAGQPAEPLFFWVDGKDQHDNKLDIDGVRFSKIAINNHDSGYSGRSIVGDSSEGCQVVWGNYNTDPVKRYFWLISNDPVGIYKYTLVDASNLDPSVISAAPKSPGYDESAARPDKMKDAHDSRWQQGTASLNFYDQTGDDSLSDQPGSAPASAPASNPAPAPADPAPASTPPATAGTDPAPAAGPADAGMINSSNIQVGGTAFLDWFNSKVAGKNPFKYKVPSDNNFKGVFDNVQGLIGKPQMSGVEFAAFFCIMYEECLNFTPVVEDPQPTDKYNEAQQHKGQDDCYDYYDAYFFENRNWTTPKGYPQSKPSYNGHTKLQNKKAGQQLQDATVISSKADVAAWNSKTTYPKSAPLAVKQAARNCDFYKFRGRGLNQTTGRKNYYALTADAIKAVSGKNLDDVGGEELDTLFTDPRIYIPAFRQFYATDSRAPLDDLANGKYQTIGIVTNDDSDYHTRFNARVKQLVDAMKGFTCGS